MFDVEGDVDVYTAPRLKQLIQERVEGGSSRIVVNLARVQFLDSTGLAVMVGGARRARESDGELVLAGPNRQVEKILQITDLSRVLPVYPSVEEAVGAGGDAP